MLDIDYQTQLERAREFIRHIRRVVWVEETPGQHGYHLRKPGGSRVGFVRYNVAGSNAGCFTVYAYYPFHDPKHLFQNNSSTQSKVEWHLIIDPSDWDAVAYAVRVLESSYDIE